MNKMRTLTIGGTTFEIEDPNAIDSSELEAMVDSKLEEAKASGDFKGDPGTPGSNGKDGKDGANGKTPYIQNGYWYIDGVNTNVKAQATDGINGKDGKDGDDYVLTESDKADIANTVGENYKGAIAQLLIEELQGLPVFGVVDENNAVTVTSLLPDGTYKLKYENDDGTTTEIGIITVGDGGDEVITYEVDIASVGYTDNARWSTTDGTIRTGATGTVAINTIPFTRESGQTMTITLSGITWVDTAANTAQILLLIGDSFTSGHNMALKDLPKTYSDIGISGVLNADGTVTVTIVDGAKGHFDGFKVCGVGTGANAKITITIE